MPDHPFALTRVAGIGVLLALSTLSTEANGQRLSAPTGLTVTGTAASATVTWQPVEGALNYSVRRWKQDDLNCCNNSVAELTTPTWTDYGARKEGFPQYGVYVFEVSAQSSTGSSSSATMNWTSPVIASLTALPLHPKPLDGPTGKAGGDLDGTYPNPHVGKLQTTAVSNAVPSPGQVLMFNGNAWAPSAPAGSGGFSKRAVVTTTKLIAVHGTSFVTTTCPVGSVVVGGGYKPHSLQGSESVPPSDTQWTMSIYNPTAYATTATVYAICLS